MTILSPILFEKILPEITAPLNERCLEREGEVTIKETAPLKKLLLH